MVLYSKKLCVYLRLCEKNSHFDRHGDRYEKKEIAYYFVKDFFLNLRFIIHAKI